MTTIANRTSEALERESASRSVERSQRLTAINERYDRLVKSGAVQPERYNIAPINPSSMSLPSIAL
ncbi:hypothetical protein [Pseudomonas putida]|uniref:hypothetical protein n=1 Tax=Pseudomonas putida TaxID=303 RepID=UPI0013A6B512|nr:hypothetical protein [Pseudomonas putida]